MFYNFTARLKQKMTQILWCCLVMSFVSMVVFITDSQASITYPKVKERDSIRFQAPESSEWRFEELHAKTPIRVMLSGVQTKVGILHEHSIVLSKLTEQGRIIPYGYDVAELMDSKGTETTVIQTSTLMPLSEPFSKPHSNELFITAKPVDIYVNANKESDVFATLFEEIRYPINAKLIDESGHYWYQIYLAGNLVYVDSDDVEIDKGISVLTFHHILEDIENKFYRGTSTTTSAEAFKVQMAHLKSLGYETISLDELYRFLNKEVNLPAKVFVITFDDGLKSVHKYGYPILKALDYQATVFLITSRIKRKTINWNPDSLQFMSISEIAEAKGVFDYQSHSHFLHKLHNKKPIIYQRKPRVIQFDVERSLRALKQFNPVANAFAYPFGAFDAKSLNAVKAAGIKIAFSTVKGRVKPGDNLLKLKRIYLLSNDSLATVENKIMN